MPETINFNKTNRIDDPGVDLTPEEVARRFWESDEGRTHAGSPKEPTERLALWWVPTNIGGWDEDPSIWPRIYDAIFDARPWRDDG